MAECPYCKASPAYVSLNIVECSNEKCGHYSKELYPRPTVQDHDDGDEDHEQRTQWIWSTHHHDFGD